MPATKHMTDTRNERKRERNNKQVCTELIWCVRVIINRAFWTFQFQSSCWGTNSLRHTNQPTKTQQNNHPCWLCHDHRFITIEHIRLTAQSFIQCIHPKDAFFSLFKRNHSHLIHQTFSSLFFISFSLSFSSLHRFTSVTLFYDSRSVIPTKKQFNCCKGFLRLRREIQRISQSPASSKRVSSEHYSSSSSLLSSK